MINSIPLLIYSFMTIWWVSALVGGGDKSETLKYDTCTKFLSIVDAPRLTDIVAQPPLKLVYMCCPEIWNTIEENLPYLTY